MPQGSGGPPIAAVSAASSISETGATLNGNVTPNGIATQAWFEYGTDSSLSTYMATPEQSIGDGLIATPLVRSVSGMTGGTSYYFRVCGRNAKGTTRSTVTTFTTSSPGSQPTVSTLAATSVAAAGATLNGNVTPNGLATDAWFEWGTDPALASYSTTSTQPIGSGVTSELVSASLTGLSTGATYHFRVAGSNSVGTSRGAIAAFTPGAAPSVTTLAATSVAAAGATLNGNVTPNGLATDAWFEWGTDPDLASYSTTSTQSMGSGTTGQPVAADLTGLSTGTTYYFRVAGSNSSGTLRGEIVGFTPGSAPSVTTLAATSVAAAGATLNGNVTANGLATDAWFEWGTDPDLASYSTTSTQSMGSGTTAQPVAADLTGLSTGTTYYFRVVGANNSGTSRGEIVGVTTSTYGRIQMGGSIQGTPLSLAGTTSTLAGSPLTGWEDGTGTAARFTLPDGITTDGTNLYVVDSSNHAIRQVAIATGEVTTLAGAGGSSGSDDGTGAVARFNNPKGIATDGTNLYVADTSNHTIRRVVIATGEVTTLAGAASFPGSADGTGSAAGFRSPAGIATDGANLYVADTSNHTIRRVAIATGEVTTLAGAASFPGSADGTGSAARFRSPAGIATDGTNLYVADSANNTIRRVVIATGEVTTLAGSAQFFGSADGTGAAARFYSPCGIATDGTHLYVADTSNCTIRRVVIATAEVTTLAGTAGAAAWGPVDGTGAAALFYFPSGITTDGTNLYVADTSNCTIRRVVIATGDVTTLAGATQSFGSADGTGAAARFTRPVGVTTDGTNLFVADTLNHTIRKLVIATGVVTTLAGNPGVLGFADGMGAAARFIGPAGVTTDGTNLYVADTAAYTIRRVVIATGEVTTLAGTAQSHGSADGTGAVARFYGPHGITTDGTNLFVTDYANCTIRRVVIATGEVTTLAGTAHFCGSADGAGAAARFNNPTGITTDGTNLYVADSWNHTIRKVTIATAEVTTFAGIPGVSGYSDGTGSTARFYRPLGITTDGTSLFVADCSNHTIRKAVIATAEVTTLAGTPGFPGSADGTGAAARFYLPAGITTDGTSLLLGDYTNNTIRAVD